MKQPALKAQASSFIILKTLAPLTVIDVAGCFASERQIIMHLFGSGLLSSRKILFTLIILIKVVIHMLNEFASISDVIAL